MGSKKKEKKVTHGVRCNYLGGRVDGEQGNGVGPGRGGDVEDDPLPPGKTRTR